ncbi:MAG: 4-(cytidine 5'-diphospho)-2-C-methyl-D-erythritol kinase [Mycobacteriales bacterium]
MLSSRRTHDRVTVRAPGKINLHLSVGRRRPDGFHDLTTVFHAVGLYDDVELVRADRLTVTVTGEGAGLVPLDGSNLAVRAIHLIAGHTGHEPTLEVRIHKGIPVAGGCAGGSADAAAALVGCDALWGTALPKDELAVLGAQLGSDVPFSLHGGTALGTGRGERLTAVLGQGSYSWVLALSEGGLSTPAVYGQLDRQRETGPVGIVRDPAHVLAALRQGDAVALGRALDNDLQAAALVLQPSLRQLLDTGRDLGALGVVVSGSGPTVALLARDDGHAVALASALDGHDVCAAVRRADGPVTGARVVAAA